MTIKNVQLTPRSIEDRWNRLESARPRAHTIVGRLFTATSRRAAGRGRRVQGGGDLAEGKGRKLARSWKQSRRFNPARLRSLPGNLGPLPSRVPLVHTVSPSPPPRSHFSPFITTDDDGHVSVRGLKGRFFLREKSRARRYYMASSRTHGHTHTPASSTSPTKKGGVQSQIGLVMSREEEERARGQRKRGETTS